MTSDSKFLSSTKQTKGLGDDNQKLLKSNEKINYQYGSGFLTERSRNEGENEYVALKDAK